MPYEISKTYVDIPFGHRQPNHAGHCHDLHGHNWGFTLVFSASKLDVCGFVVDFGGIKFIRRWLEETFDHKMVINEGDTLMREMVSQFPSLDNITWVPDCSAEGLARYVYDEVSSLLEAELSNDVFERDLKLVSVTVREDSKNTATYRR